MKPLKVLYICTTFPKLSEQFIQREVDGLGEEAIVLEIVSLWGGDRRYKGVVIRTFPKWQLLKLIWSLPLAILRKPRVLLGRTSKFFSGIPPSSLNFFETLLGYGFALAHWTDFEKRRHGSYLLGEYPKTIAQVGRGLPQDKSHTSGVNRLS